MHLRPCPAPSGGQKRRFCREQVIFLALIQCTISTSAYHEVRFFVHFCLAIRVNFERVEFQMYVRINPSDNIKFYFSFRKDEPKGSAENKDDNDIYLSKSQINYPLFNVKLSGSKAAGLDMEPNSDYEVVWNQLQSLKKCNDSKNFPLTTF